jgi:nucleoside 2-deoxyribosyltransferase
MIRPRVYISGPISKGDRQTNFDRASKAHRDLLDAGFAPLNPILTMLLQWEGEIPHDDWIDADLPWVAQADAVLRLPGESTGAEHECTYAMSLGIPVYCCISDLIAERQYLGQRIQPEAKTDEEIRIERQQVYGDPLENHKGIAQMWAPLLQPHWRTIKDGMPIQAHVVALMMVALKLDRMRLVYHADNFADARNYLAFAEEFQTCTK